MTPGSTCWSEIPSSRHAYPLQDIRQTGKALRGSGSRPRADGESILTTYIHRGRFVAGGNVAHERNGIRFNWDREKVEINLRKHGVSFDAACEIFFDPLIHLHRSEMLGGEKRETA